MIKKIELVKNVIYVYANSKLNNRDYDKLIAILTENIDSAGSINLFFQMEMFSGNTLSTFWNDLRYNVKKKHKLNKVALVGNNEWKKIMSELFTTINVNKIECFNEIDKVEAKKWLLS